MNSTSESLTKKLMNFISNEKENLKNSSYDTIGNGDNEKIKSKNNNNSKNNDNLLNIENKNNNDLNTSDSLSHYLEKESNERMAKLVRFGVDYCRASPNINLKNKTLLNIGWRVQKFNYEVDYGIVNFKGEKLSVI
jgi:hypothetical protein